MQYILVQRISRWLISPQHLRVLYELKQIFITFELLEMSDCCLWLPSNICNAPVSYSQKNASLILYFVSLRTFIISINLVYFMFSSDLLRHSIQGLGKTFLELYRSDILLKDIRGYSQRSFLSASVEGFAKSGALFKLQ